MTFTRASLPSRVPVSRMADKDTVIRALAHLLPSDFRERVFEPALSDLHLDEAHSSTRAGRFLARALLVAECLRLGVPDYLWRRGRPTRLGTVLVGIGLAVALVFQRMNYGATAHKP